MRPDKNDEGGANPTTRKLYRQGIEDIVIRSFQRHMHRVPHTTLLMELCKIGLDQPNGGKEYTSFRIRQHQVVVKE